MTSLLTPGAAAPWFRAAEIGGNPAYGFDTVAGRWVMMLFLGPDDRDPAAAQALAALARHRDLFDDDQACFFGLVDQPGAGRPVPGQRWMMDEGHRIAAAYRATGADGAYRRHWLLLDPMLRVHAAAGLAGGERLLAALRDRVAAPPPALDAPVLRVPGVLSPDLCRALIADYERHGGHTSGFMREENGLTVERHNDRAKRRDDHHVEDAHLLGALRERLSTVLRPMIRRAFQFDATRVERYLVARYDGARQGGFRAHRDNTTRGTAHRQFACTIILNAEGFEGGDLCFPEFGRRAYRAATGEAVVFSCSLLHEAQPVTRGRRYAFLPFLYDEAGARLRERNQAFVAPELRGYRAAAA